MAVTRAQLAQLLVREYPKLAAYTWSLVHDDHLVEDVLQELALIATRQCDEIVDETHFLGWMRIACRRIASDHLKRRHRLPGLLSAATLDLLDKDWSEFDSATSTDAVEALRHCLEQLSPYSRNLMELRYTQGHKSAEIAKLLKRNVNTVYIAITRVHRTLGECIRKCLAKEEI